MKKMIALTLALLLVLSLAACGGNSNTGNGGNGGTSSGSPSTPGGGNNSAPANSTGSGDNGKNDGSNPLVGLWIESDDGSGVFIKNLEFKNNNEYILKWTYEEDGEIVEDDDVEEGTYKIEGNKLTMTDSDDNVDSGTFEIGGNKLFFTNSVGEQLVFIKE